MSATESRAAHGARQSLFRDVNERIRAIAHETGAQGGREVDFICECVDDLCAERVLLTVDEYERLRSQARCFAVAPGAGHVEAEIERVVSTHERYWVVEKLGEAGRVAEQLDPRGGSNGQPD